jgi:hypothetical protein
LVQTRGGDFDDACIFLFAAGSEIEGTFLPAGLGAGVQPDAEICATANVENTNQQPMIENRNFQLR